MSLHFKDFEISRGKVYVKTTDVTVPITWAYTKDTLNWLTFFMVHRFKCFFTSKRFRLHSIPAKPHAWHLLWAAGHGAGVDFNAAPDRADAVLYFEDQIHSEWRGMDVLRDKSDGRIYVVDVNRTDMGPPLALRLSDKLRSVDILSQALRAYLIQINTPRKTTPAMTSNCQTP